MYELIVATNKLTIATQEATQAFKELDAKWRAMEKRYNPLVWLFINIYYMIVYKLGL